MPETLEGTVERITYYNDQNGYAVARFQPRGKAYLVTVIGNLMSVNVGESLRLRGFWSTHPQYGRQFQIKEYTVLLPATIEGIRKYLGSGLIKGIGPVTARRITDHFGLDTLEIIEKAPGRLTSVPGVGPRRVEMIKKAWEEQRSIKEVMLFLQSRDVSTSLAVKIYKEYGDAAISVVKNEPYRLARDVYGIGFLTADKIARSMGVEKDSPQRVEAGVRYVLGQFSDDGHVYAARGELVRESARILGVPSDLVEEGIESLNEDGEICIEGDAVYLLPFYYAEVGVANRLQTLVNVEKSRLGFYDDAHWERVFAYLNERMKLPLTSRQREAVRTALTSKVSVLTGGPGTGKTTTVRTIIRLLKANGKSFLLAAPTGRAAKRLSEATGQQAKTIHRLLEFSPGEGYRFRRNEHNPLDADMIIVDETSMIDLLLMNSLLKAIPPTSHLLLVGDVDQLPSVGAGNVLRDIIGSELVPIVRLDTIFRQPEGSVIVVNAHRINSGKIPLLARSAKDFFLFAQQDPKTCADLIIDLVKQRVPHKFGYDPLEDIQVLSPMYRGEAGVTKLNRRLQEAINPAGPDKAEYGRGSRVFREGDRVVQMRNNYQKAVFNGDLGRVERIDFEDRLVTVNIDEEKVSYRFDELDELVPAYAMTVHKSQGSEYPVVVMPIIIQHYIMLQRNLLYTGVTRAEELIVLVGTKRAMAIAVKNDKIAKRHSGLTERLSSGKAKSPRIGQS